MYILIVIEKPIKACHNKMIDPNVLGYI